jgi:predicted AAA+ superfamily ATPase
MVHRPELLDHLWQYRDSEQLVKVLTGVRRCGKSTLMNMFQERLLSQGVPQASVLSLNFEDFELSDIDSDRRLAEFIGSHDFPDGKRYILLDEVQLVPGWERVINSLRLNTVNDIYITGSNLKLLGSKLASLLSGRYVRIDVYPLSFAEYLDAVPGVSDSVRTAFSEYLRTGGMPGLLNLPEDDQVRREYLDAVYNTILMKDIVAQNQIRDVDALQKIIRFLVANIGNQITVSRITNYLVSSGRKVSDATVDNYLRILQDAFLFYRAERLDLQSKETMKTNDKFYLVDPGFRSLLFGMGLRDMGRLLENAVYFELLRRGFQVSVGKYGATEVDFVATKPESGTLYLQVTQSMLNEDTATRELAPLRAIPDNYPRFVLSLDEIATRDYEGIRHLDLVQFLTGGGF